jgi:CubicO group peptidase (beta-lactamase class C family)
VTTAEGVLYDNLYSPPAILVVTEVMASMRYLLRYAVLLTTISTSLAQNCPLLGPAYPKLTNPASSTFLQGAKSTFDADLAQALGTGQLDNKTAIFSLQVFSSHSDDPLYEYHYAAAGSNGSLSGNTLNSGTLYRIGSISKLVSVYSILSKLSDEYWDEPVVKYVPELARAPWRNAVDNVKWSDITLGELAGQVSGIGRDCKLSCVALFVGLH